MVLLDMLNVVGCLYTSNYREMLNSALCVLIFFFFLTSLKECPSHLASHSKGISSLGTSLVIAKVLPFIWHTLTVIVQWHLKKAVIYVPPSVNRKSKSMKAYLRLSEHTCSILYGKKWDGIGFGSTTLSSVKLFENYL